MDCQVSERAGLKCVMLYLPLVGSEYQGCILRQPSAVLFALSRSRSLHWGKRWEGKGSPGRWNRPFISTTADICTTGNSSPSYPTSLQIPKALKLWTKSLQASSVVNGKNERDGQKDQNIPQDFIWLGWTQVLMSATAESETRHHLPIFTIYFHWLVEKKLART